MVLLQLVRRDMLSDQISDAVLYASLEQQSYLWDLHLDQHGHDLQRDHNQRQRWTMRRLYATPAL